MQTFDPDYEKNLLDLMVLAFEQPQEKRRAFLLDICHDEPLVEDVLNTLEEEEELGDFLETPALIQMNSSGLTDPSRIAADPNATDLRLLTQVDSTNES